MEPDSKTRLHRRYVSWRVHLLSASIFPELQSIHSFEVSREAAINKIEMMNQALFTLDYRVLVNLTFKLPNLEYYLPLNKDALSEEDNTLS